MIYFARALGAFFVDTFAPYRFLYRRTHPAPTRFGYSAIGTARQTTTARLRPHRLCAIPGALPKYGLRCADSPHASGRRTLHRSKRRRGPVPSAQ